METRPTSITVHFKNAYLFQKEIVRSMGKQDDRRATNCSEAYFLC